MGNSKSSINVDTKTAADTTMKNLYDLASNCESNQTQKQSLELNMTDSFSTGVSQTQTASSNLSCLSNNQLTQLFDSNFKTKL